MTGKCRGKPVMVKKKGWGDISEDRLVNRGNAPPVDPPPIPLTVRPFGLSLTTMTSDRDLKHVTIGSHAEWTERWGTPKYWSKDQHMHLQRNLLYYRLFISHWIFLRLPGQSWNPFNYRSDPFTDCSAPGLHSSVPHEEITINSLLVKE